MFSIVGAGPQGTPPYSFRGDGAADRMIWAADLPAKITGVRAIHVGLLATVVRPIGEALQLLVFRESSNCVVAAPWIRAGARLVVLTRGEFGVSAGHEESTCNFQRNVSPSSIRWELATRFKPHSLRDLPRLPRCRRKPLLSSTNRRSLGSSPLPFVPRRSLALDAAPTRLVAPSFRRYMAANPLASNMAVPLCPLGRLLGPIRTSPTGIAAVDNHDAPRHKACRV